MQRFHFEQDELLRLRRQFRQRAEMRLQKASAHCRALHGELQHAHDELQKASHQMESIVADPWRWIQRTRWLQENIQMIRQGLRLAEQVRDDAQRQLREAENEVEILESLRSTAWDAHRSESLRRQQIESDETALRQWNRTRQESPSEEVVQ